MSENEFFINPSEYELTDEELAIFMQLPEWHQTALLNWNDDWRLKDFVVESYGVLDFESWDLPDSFPVSKCVIKKGLAACIDVENITASKRWMRYQKIIEPMTSTMSLGDLSIIVFPFQSYSFVAQELEDGLFALGFRDGVISIDELHATLIKTDWLGVSAVIAFGIWSAYIRDWKEYVTYMNKKHETYVLSFNKRTVETIFGGILFGSVLVKSEVDSSGKSDSSSKLEGLLDSLSSIATSKSNQSKFLNKTSKPMRDSTVGRHAEYFKIYQQVVADMGAGSRKGSLIDEAAKRAGCSEKTMREAVKANK